MKRTRLFVIASVCTAALLVSGCLSRTEPGVTSEHIVLGSVLPLQGPTADLGQSMRNGLQAAVRGRTVDGRSIEIRFQDDSSRAAKAVEGTNRLIAGEDGIFLMVGNVGAANASATLPILDQAGIPAVGFLTGADSLRTGHGPMLNFRASFVEEVTAVVDQAVARGVRPNEVCVYAQNDAYGMDGVKGVRNALSAHSPSDQLIALYNEVLARSGERPVRNNIGPIGVYTPNTTEVSPGYRSLKAWEERNNVSCRLVVTAGGYENVANFVRYTRKSENWVVSALSITGADDLRKNLRRYGIDSGVLMTQVVPRLESSLPIVTEARRALGSDFNHISLEGYIIARMVLHLLESMEADLNRGNFMAHARQASFDLGGLEIDFPYYGHQASRLVNIESLARSGWRLASGDIWEEHLVSR